MKTKFVEFEVKKFASGEWDVKIISRIYGNRACIQWNWFDESQRDIMLLLMKIGAIRRQYGEELAILICAAYLPYSRQDRMFEAGQDIPLETLLQTVCKNDRLITFDCFAFHSSVDYWNYLYNIRHSLGDKNMCYVFPDQNAINHYDLYHIDEDSVIILDKVRYENVIKLVFKQKPEHKKLSFLICDDICAGGRTFVECAKALRKEYGDEVRIELIVYNAFLDHGIDALHKAGISKIYIINPDSYEYICNLYPAHQKYFEYQEISK